MMNNFKYKEYYASIEYSDEDDCFIGHIANITDIIGFHGDSILELKQAFKESVDDYITRILDKAVHAASNSVLS
jgi:predicted HicB family RNase H-like nuclease